MLTELEIYESATAGDVPDSANHILQPVTNGPRI